MGKMAWESAKDEMEVEVKLEQVPFFPNGKEGVKLMAQLSTNLRPEVHQRYITLGAVCAAYPEANTNEIIDLLRGWGFWED